MIDAEVRMSGRTTRRRASRGRSNGERRSWLHEHSLTLVLAAMVGILLLLYRGADPATHIGAFYGNAAADWLGSFVVVFATKFWYERGSAESKSPAPEPHSRFRFFHDHSLTIVVLFTWIFWIWWYVHIDPTGKTGQVVGNIVSEWSQLLSLVWFTKYLVEKGSKESSSGRRR
jgi:hypothetical protein